MIQLLDYTWQDLENLSENFANELTLSLEKKATSLAFFRHPMPEKPLVTPGQIFQVMSIGGSNLETALISQSPDGDFVIKESRKLELPKLVNIHIFVDEVLAQIEPNIEVLALNFAYPLKPCIRENYLDGELLQGTKEHTFEGLVGEMVGEKIEKSSASKGHTLKVICANDVVCLTLASLASDHNLSTDILVSMVLGTGNNIGMTVNSNEFVNLESGNFNRFQQTPSGKHIDENSLANGKQWLEKEIAGAYLAKHFNYYSDLAGLGINFSEAIQVNQLAETNELGSDLARAIVYRSAALVAATLKGIWLFKKKMPLVCSVEGSIYWKGYNFAASVDHVLERLELPQESISFVKVPQSNLLGAAELAVYQSS